MEISNQQMNQVTNELEQLKDKTGAEVEKRREQLNQKAADPNELVNESRNTFQHVQQWKYIGRIEHRLARFPEIIHLPFVISVIMICGQQISG